MVQDVDNIEKIELNLPIEIWAKIFSYLGTGYQCVMSPVCSFFREICPSVTEYDVKTFVILNNNITLFDSVKKEYRWTSREVNMAAKRGKFDSLQYLVLSKQVNPDTDAVLSAIEGNHLEIVQWLISPEIVKRYILIPSLCLNLAKKLKNQDIIAIFTIQMGNNILSNRNTNREHLIYFDNFNKKTLFPRTLMD